MERKQIYLTKSQIEDLERLAEERDVPASSMIRDAIDMYLSEQDEPVLKDAEEHPLWGIVGLAKSTDAPKDGSVNHNEPLYKPRRRRES